MNQPSASAWTLPSRSRHRTTGATERRGVCHVAEVLPFVLARMEAAAARPRYDQPDRSSTRKTANDRGPWAPITSDCSMSAVFEGPEMKQPNSA